MSQFAQLIDAVSDQKGHSLSDVLLKAKVLAHRLKSRRFRQWISAEIDGYSTEMTLPDYRVVKCGLYGHFAGPFQSSVRNVPLSANVPGANARRALTINGMPQSIAFIEDLAGQDNVGVDLDFRLISYLRIH